MSGLSMVVKHISVSLFSSVSQDLFCLVCFEEGGPGGLVLALFSIRSYRHVPLFSNLITDVCTVVSLEKKTHLPCLQHMLCMTANLTSTKAAVKTLWTERWANRDSDRNKQRQGCVPELVRKQLFTDLNTLTAASVKGAKCWSDSMEFIVGTASSPVAVKALLPKQSMSDYQQLETMSFL